MDASPSASRLIAWTKFAVFAAAVVGVIANLAVWFAMHFLFRDHWSPAPGLELPVIASLDPTALALSLTIGAALRRGAGLPTALLIGMGGGFVLRGLGQLTDIGI